MTAQYVLEEVAKAIRQCYIEARRRQEEARTGHRSNYTPGPWWDGGVTKRSRVRRGNYWLRLAKQFTERGIDYQAYIDHVFNNWHAQFVTDRNHYAPQPNQLGNAEWQNSFLRDAQRGIHKDQKRRAFLAQQQEAHRAILEAQEYGMYKDNRQVLKAVLTNSSLSLSALFRYCCAFHEGLTEVQKFYKMSALLQYGRAIRDYNEVWKEWIPETLREEAEQVFQFYGGRNGKTEARIAD